MGPYLKVYTGIKEKKLPKKNFYGQRKFVFWSFFSKLGWNYYIKICWNKDSSFPQEIKLFVSAMQCGHGKIGKIKVRARSGIKKWKNLNFRQLKNKAKKGFRGGSNSGPPACKSVALTIPPSGQA